MYIYIHLSVYLSIYIYLYFSFEIMRNGQLEALHIAILGPASRPSSLRPLHFGLSRFLSFFSLLFLSLSLPLFLSSSLSLSLALSLSLSLSLSLFFLSFSLSLSLARARARSHSLSLFLSVSLSLARAHTTCPLAGVVSFSPCASCPASFNDPSVSSVLDSVSLSYPLVCSRSLSPFNHAHHYRDTRTHTHIYTHYINYRDTHMTSITVTHTSCQYVSRHQPRTPLP